MPYIAGGHMRHDEALGETEKRAVLSRDKGCILCNRPVDGIAPIVSKTDKLDWQISWMNWTQVTSDFKKNQPQNLISHYDDQNFILVPSEENLDLMIEFETKDMDQRLKAIEARYPDPGRSVPPFDMMCEYAFLHSTYAEVRVIGEFTETRDDPGALPQVVTYTFFNHRVLTIGPANVWIDRRGTDYIRFMLRLDVNPFALIANALLGLHSAFVEPQLWLDGDSPENDSSQQFVSRVSLLASKLLTLRNLYNRRPDEIIGISIEAQEPRPCLLIATG